MTSHSNCWFAPCPPPSRLHHTPPQDDTDAAARKRRAAQALGLQEVEEEEGDPEQEAARRLAAKALDLTYDEVIDDEEGAGGGGAAGGRWGAAAAAQAAVRGLLAGKEGGSRGGLGLVHRISCQLCMPYRPPPAHLPPCTRSPYPAEERAAAVAQTQPLNAAHAVPPPPHPPSPLERHLLMLIRTTYIVTPALRHPD